MDSLPADYLARVTKCSVIESATRDGWLACPGGWVNLCAKMPSVRNLCINGPMLLSVLSHSRFPRIEHLQIVHNLGDDVWFSSPHLDCDELTLFWHNQPNRECFTDIVIDELYPEFVLDPVQAQNYPFRIEFGDSDAYERVCVYDDPIDVSL
jgi:hypothetical protein